MSPMIKLLVGIVSPLFVLAPVACSEPTPTPTTTPLPAPAAPTPVAMPTPMVETLPVGWTRHAAHNFEIGFPADWIALEVSVEAIDAMIRATGGTNPQLIPFLEALKDQQAMKFWAMDPASPPGRSINISVGYEVRLIPLDRYADAMKVQLETVGMTIVDEGMFSLSGRNALRLQVEGAVATPSGQPIPIKVRQVVVDQGGDRYLITLTYVPEKAREYEELFDRVLGTFTIVR